MGQATEKDCKKGWIRAKNQALHTSMRPSRGMVGSVSVYGSPTKSAIKNLTLANSSRHPSI